MQVIQLKYPLDLIQTNTEAKVMALGFFDGVHRGHQAVIKRAVKIGHDRQLPVAVMTFNLYPGIVFNKVKASEFTYLSSVARKAAIMADLGVDLLYVVDFTQAVGQLQPQDFVDQFLVDLGVKVAVAGFDYTYGRPIERANMAVLPDYAQGRFEVVTVAEQTYQQHKISSTAIRTALADGDVDLADELLGYPYQTQGTVVHGEARGRELGFPTANVASTDNQRWPGIGIYATAIQVQGRWYPAMTSVGRNVTFGDNRPVTVEVNILDFNQDIYDQTVDLRWYHYLRGEVKFTGAAGLITQLKQDEQATRDYFQNYSLEKEVNDVPR
ncbi:riboflavin biosynthesis protein RibF [Lapidilactobacillus wuchangensis]|uniref:riboflavin biosynthesis protein RibF n=1 Tax=Lapidilactobacillus wuchangensis TaxID=2486001 RepID=UPI000F7B1681|nr:riboflavin biosynthesis protein RibF [Lapidilactobacillus wuchangensis]